VVFFATASVDFLAAKLNLEFELQNFRWKLWSTNLYREFHEKKIVLADFGGDSFSVETYIFASQSEPPSK